MSLRDLSDEECVLLAQTGNADALNHLIMRYQKYSYGLAINFYNTNRQSGINVDELCSVAEEMIITAITNFSNCIQMFYPYWRTIATNEMIKYNEQNSYFHHARTFNGISLNDENEDNFSNDQILGEPDYKIDESLLVDSYFELLEDPKNGFSNNEKKVMKLTYEGYEPTEIMKLLKWTKSQVYYALKNAKQKITAILSKIW